MQQIRYRRWQWLLVLAGLWIGMASCPAAERAQDFQNWDVVTLTVPLEPQKKLLGYMEVQPRVGQDFSAILVRPAIGYQVHPRVSVWQGYAWTPVFVPAYRNENRLFQQVVMNHELKKLKVINRTRLEQRFIQDTRETSVRGRHMVRLMLPLDKGQRWSAVLQEELFINFNSVDNGPQAGFDQNRAFAGIHRMLGNHANAELGYMNGYLNQETIPDRVVHALVFTLNVQIK